MRRRSPRIVPVSCAGRTAGFDTRLRPDLEAQVEAWLGGTAGADASGADAGTRGVVRDLRVTGADQGIRFDSGSTIRCVTVQDVSVDHNTGPGISLRESTTYQDIVLSNVTAEYNSFASAASWSAV